MGPRLFVRIAISLLLLWHLFAVFMAPLSLPPTSPLVSRLVQGTAESASPLQWYLDALYLNHGYHFFAPDPGPAHLIRYRVMDERNEILAEGEFPDLENYWPRLRYHRYFMLSEQVEAPIPDQSPEETQRLVLSYYAQHLLRTHEGESAHVTRVRHYMMSPAEKRDMLALEKEGRPAPDMSHKFETVMEVVQRASDLAERPSQPDDAAASYGAWQSTPGSYRGLR